MRKNPGISLLEIMISLFIFSCVLLCWDAMQITIARLNNGSLHFNIALSVIEAIDDHLEFFTPDISVENYLQKLTPEIPLQNLQINFKGNYPSYLLNMKWDRGLCKNEWIKTCININTDLV